MSQPFDPVLRQENRQRQEDEREGGQRQDQGVRFGDGEPGLPRDDQDRSQNEPQPGEDDGESA